MPTDKKTKASAMKKLQAVRLNKAKKTVARKKAMGSVKSATQKAMSHVKSNVKKKKANPTLVQRSRAKEGGGGLGASGTVGRSRIAGHSALRNKLRRDRKK